MSTTDIERLNSYHKQVYDTISGYLTEEEREWLREYTKPVK